MDSIQESSAHRRGIPSARSQLQVARIAASRYLAARAEPEPNKYEMMLYYGAFFFFARSALSALQKSDGRMSSELNSIQQEYFASEIKDDPVFVLLKNERDRVGHGDDSWAFHPMMPVGMIDRFKGAGHDWSVAVFNEIWPDEPFRGEKIDAVMEAVYRKISGRLDDIDCRDDERHRVSLGNLPWATTATAKSAVSTP